MDVSSAHQATQSSNTHILLQCPALRISLINTDEEADTEPYTPADYTEDPVKFHKVDNPNTENVSVLVANQSIRLKSIDIIRRKQKSFCVFISADNGFWFQRILLRDARSFGASKPEEINYFDSYTQVYKQNLDPNLNQAYRFEMIVKQGAFGRGKSYRTLPILFNDGKSEEFPMLTKDAINKNHKWYPLHWNGYILEKSQIGMMDFALDSPLRN